MSGDYVALTPWNLVIAASLVVVSATLSLLLRLGLEKQLLLATARTTVQLILLSLLLRWIFAAGQWYFVLALMASMTLIAGWAAMQRVERGYAGLWFDSVLSIWASSWCITAVALFGVVGVEPWYRPQYAIPLLGMILHNTLTGLSLGMDRFNSELVANRGTVETLLALGATRWEAAQSAMRHAIRTGMIPTINSMMVIGVVSIPGMMTGQLLAGVDPLQAGFYQMAIMFLIAASVSLGTVCVVLLGYRRLFTRDHQFVPGRLKPRQGGALR